jgi:hypothetical protein
MAQFDPSMITKAGDLEAVPALVKKVNLLADKDGESARQDMKNAARDLFLALETPREAMIRQIWAEVRDTNFPSSWLPDILRMSETLQPALKNLMLDLLSLFDQQYPA